jgi:hypothetical protein
MTDREIIFQLITTILGEALIKCNVAKIEKMRVYVSSEIYYEVTNVGYIYGKVKFVMDSDRRNLEYGYSLKKEIINDVKDFFN